MESPLPYPPLNTAMEKSPLLLPCQTVALPAGLSRTAVLPAAGAVTTGHPPPNQLGGSVVSGEEEAMAGSGEEVAR